MVNEKTIMVALAGGRAFANLQETPNAVTSKVSLHVYDLR
jgi:hypothetical protein